MLGIVIHAFILSIQGGRGQPGPHSELQHIESPRCVSGNHACSHCTVLDQLLTWIENSEILEKS